jgi:hypothetical protein
MVFVLISISGYIERSSALFILFLPFAADIVINIQAKGKKKEKTVMFHTSR